MFRKVLIANRGEIAVRVIRALREMGIPSVAVYSDADRASLHVRMADEAAHIGPAPSPESYLRIDRILDAARRHAADAIHPGYGFLSENPAFASACEAKGIVFIGPNSSAIETMGSKTSARRLALEAGVPVVPGTVEGLGGVSEAKRFAREFGYPILLKAVAGGGGKGMRRVYSDEEFEAAWREAGSEAERAFKDASLYIEKLIVEPRHIEIQLIGDRHGNLISLGERECTLQRRHQKLIEESPSPLVAARPGMRARMSEAALRVARAAGYDNAGTVEFLADQQGSFYFLEMNTRLQVEHPVTELVTGLDLVKLQVRIAAGEKLPVKQEDVVLNGSAIECRIYAEDPDNDFVPSPGRIAHLSLPAGPGVRIDSGIYPGWTVPLEYDPLLAKLAVWAESRDEAIDRMLRALAECQISGIVTNTEFFRRLLRHQPVRKGDLDTGLVDRFLALSREELADDALESVAALVAAVHHSELMKNAEPCAGNGGSRSLWREEGREQLFR
ncbi:MAG: acetyl-CoA carboxylase biotin carboxylase subunit [Bryobacteraceae bacterium]